MLSSLFIHNIYVVREVNPTQGSLGNPAWSHSSVPGDNLTIPCRIEEYKDTVQYRESNLRDKNSTIIYIPSQYHLVLHDAVYNAHTGQYLGLVSGIDTALGAGSSIDHYEISVENP